MSEIQILEIPTKWPLGVKPRYIRQNMERAMLGKIERGLTELITNADDSYRNLEDIGEEISGEIRIEIKRRKKEKTSIVRLIDFAGGMSKEELYDKLGTLGGRTSGFERGKARRGLHGRGARDVAAFGTVHFESIKDGRYNHLVIPQSLECYFKESYPLEATEKIRKKLRIPRGNGTVVTIEVKNRFKIPRHETLVKNFSRYYSLRDIFSNPRRKVTIVDLNTRREDPLTYEYPKGEEVFSGNITIPGYPKANAILVVRKHVTSFDRTILPYRDGVLVKSVVAIHDCTYFDLEPEPYAWKFSGELKCEYIDELIREYDNQEEENPDDPKHPEDNPLRLLDPSRDGVVLDHPFITALFGECRKTLGGLIAKIKAAEETPTRNVTDEKLNKKLDKLSKKITKIFERKMKELEEELPPVPPDDELKKLSVGLHIIPPGEQDIIVNKSKTFSVVIKHREALDESLPIVINSTNDDVKVRNSPVYIKKFVDEIEKTIGRTTFTLESSKVGTSARIDVHYGNYRSSVEVKVIEIPSAPELPTGLSFDKPKYRLKINKTKTLILWFKSDIKLNDEIIADISSDHPHIIVKGNGKCKLHKTDESKIWLGKCRIVGQESKTKGKITAFVEGFEPVAAHVFVQGPQKKFKFIPVEEEFGSVRYKWDKKNPYLLKIGAKHPSIRRYLGKPIEQEYPGIDSSLYHTVLAEVIAEALTFHILEKQFKSEGQEGMLDYASTDAYYHIHFSEFLSITHKSLVTNTS